MEHSIVTKANERDDLVRANMNKASAILQTMLSLQCDGNPMNEEVTGNLLWSACDLLSEAIEADGQVMREELEGGICVRYEPVFSAKAKFNVEKN